MMLYLYLIQRRKLSRLGNIFWHGEIHERELKSTIFIKREIGRPRMALIKQACSGVSKQTDVKLKRAAREKSQWRGIIRMLHGQP